MGFSEALQRWAVCLGLSAPGTCHVEWGDGWLVLGLFVGMGVVGLAGRQLVTTVVTWRALALTPIFSRYLSQWVQSRDFSEDEFFRADGAEEPWIELRKKAIERLSVYLQAQHTKSIAWGDATRESFSDLRFTDAHRVPFPFMRLMRDKFNLCSVVTASEGPRLRDLDGRWSLDVSGSYGVNVAGFERYKEWIQSGWNQVKELGPVLGPLHPVVADNIARLKAVSKMDEVSFHMSGTEAVMAAVRLVRFNTRRKLIVCFSGAYHGWWDGVQPGLGSERHLDDCLALKDLNPASLDVIRRLCKEIAGVLINPVQSFHPNSPPPNDAVLLTSEMRKTQESSSAYAQWLRQLRVLCSEYNIPLIFDEVYTGFRLAPGGAQAFFGVQADMVVYGKTVAGGMPIGVVCGQKELMRRFDPKRPMRIAYVIGTFSAHPAVMGAMHEFLQWVQQPSTAELYETANQRCGQWVEATNREFANASLPVRVVRLATVWTLLFKEPSRYNWLLQYYLRAEGVTLSWVGTGRCLSSLDFTVEDYNELQVKLLRAAQQMKSDGWWLTEMDQPGRNKKMKFRLMWELLGNLIRIPKPLQQFYAEVMRRKVDDHHASHSHLVNQFFHLISSSIFIYCYILAFTDLAKATCFGLASLFLRQFGHAIIEPPCHDKEEVLLGFNTRNKTLIVVGYGLIPIVHMLGADAWTLEGLKPLLTPVAEQWFFLTLAVVLGRVLYLIWEHNFGLSMVWLIKLMTDPFTDIVAYYPSAYGAVKGFMPSRLRKR